MKICLVIPTYNERGNLQSLIHKTEAVLSKNRLEGYVVIVDDNSSDGTGELAEQLAKEYRNSTVIHRQARLGIGSAYKEGFQMVLKDLDIDVVIEMDADLSHDPAYIPILIKKMDEGYDVVVGSRYVEGGGTSDWSFTRRVISKGANFLARMLTGAKVSDMTSGFRAYRAEALKSIDLQDVKSDGYAFQVEILYRCARAGLKIAEYPIIFKERSKGKSKLRKGAFLKFLKTLVSMSLDRITAREGTSQKCWH